MTIWLFILICVLLLSLPSIVVFASNFTDLYNASVVSLGTSMEPVLSKGDIIFSRTITKTTQITVGDYIIYQTNDLAPEYICHQVIEIDSTTVTVQGINETDSETVPYNKIKSQVICFRNNPLKIQSKFILLPQSKVS